jgi:hypothetical protein
MILFTSLSKIFLLGGVWQMISISVFLVALFFAAWKAPGWVKEIGIGALVTSLLFVLIAWINATSAIIECNGNISPILLWNGARYAAINILYGLIVYFVSLVIRVIEKPRI